MKKSLLPLPGICVMPKGGPVWPLSAGLLARPMNDAQKRAMERGAWAAPSARSIKLLVVESNWCEQRVRLESGVPRACNHVAHTYTTHTI